MGVTDLVYLSLNYAPCECFGYDCLGRGFVRVYGNYEKGCYAHRRVAKTPNIVCTRAGAWQRKLIEIWNLLVASELLSTDIHVQTYKYIYKHDKYARLHAICIWMSWVDTRKWHNSVFGSSKWTDCVLREILRSEYQEIHGERKKTRTLHRSNVKLDDFRQKYSRKNITALDIILKDFTNVQATNNTPENIRSRIYTYFSPSINIFQ